MHRTTIELDGKLLKRLKVICLRERKTFKGLILDLVRSGLDSRTKTGKPSRGLAGWETSRSALPKGIDPSDRDTYWQALERPLP